MRKLIYVCHRLIRPAGHHVVPMLSMVVLSLLPIMLCTSCGNGMGRLMRAEGEAQGTYYSILYYDGMQRDIRHSVDSLLDDFDLTASLWVDSSLIRRVNDNGDSVVNNLFAELVEISSAMHQFTEGAFDCTVGDIVRAWGFGFSKRDSITGEAIDSMLRFVGPQPTIVSDGQGRLIVRKPFPQTTFDFNAIAQGYATDMLCRFLDGMGISSYVVDIGGEVRARGLKPDGSPWRVGIERPSQNKYSDRMLQTAIRLDDCAVVTSGNYRKYYEQDGVRYSHTIDPATGHPVSHSLLSVSVVDSSAWRADALATAFMVMGLERSLDFIGRHPDDSGCQAVFFIYSDGDSYATYATPLFQNIVQE